MCIRDRSAGDDGVCGAAPAQALVAGLVAVTSTAMHGYQMRVLPESVTRSLCSCCGAGGGYARTLARLKRVDVICALNAALFGVFCHGFDALGRFLLVVPLFLGSVYSKVCLHNWTAYLVLHGAWHLATAAIMARYLAL